jgi:hypothetical protein
MDSNVYLQLKADRMNNFGNMTQRSFKSNGSKEVKTSIEARKLRADLHIKTHFKAAITLQMQ